MKTKQKHLQNAGEEEDPEDGTVGVAAAVGDYEAKESRDEFGGHFGRCFLQMKFR